MKKFLACFVTAIAVFTLSTARAGDRLREHPQVRSNIELLEAWIESQMAYKGIPGMCVAVVHDQEVIYKRGYGYADIKAKKKTTPNTLYRIASHSKLFAAISIMQLRDAGRLGLDDPVKKHLPWFKLKGSDKKSLPVTLRQLMTHSSGIPREAGNQPYWTNFKFPTTDEIIFHIENLEAVFPAAIKWKYSNLAYALLGEVIAAVSGKPFDEYVERNILKPLDMSHSGVTLSSINRKRLATGYGRRLPDGSRQELPVIDAKGMAAATGVTSSVADMTRFVSWQLRLLSDDDTEVLKPSTLREMQRIHWLDPKWKHGFGLTFMIFKNADRVLVGHEGGYPGFKTSTFISPEEKLAVIVFSNSLDAQPYPGEPLSVVDRTFEWVGDAIAEAKEDPKPKRHKPMYKNLAGTYRCIWGDWQVLELDGDLVALNITHPDPKKTISVLEPLGESKTTFRVTEGDPIYPLGETVSFKIGKGGTARLMMFGQLEVPRVQ